MGREGEEGLAAVKHREVPVHYRGKEKILKGKREARKGGLESLRTLRRCKTFHLIREEGSWITKGGRSDVTSGAFTLT